jgi:lipoprotein-releasing system permease protein
VPIQITWSDILLLNIGTLVICLLVLIVPSTLVTKISPVKAIRFK